MSQNELHFHDVIKLYRDDLQSEGPDGTQLVTLGMLPALCISLVDNRNIANLTSLLFQQYQFCQMQNKHNTRYNETMKWNEMKSAMI